MFGCILLDLFYGIGFSAKSMVREAHPIMRYVMELTFTRSAL